MARTYTVDNARVTQYFVDIGQQMVTVHYDEVENDIVLKRGVAFFHVTLPETPTPQDFLLPASYTQTLLDLANDASNAIKNKLEI